MVRCVIILWQSILVECFALIAQLDRASGYGPEGREFESSSARQTCATIKHKSPKPLRNQGFFAVLVAIFKR